MDLSIQWPLVIFSLLAGIAGALAATTALCELTGRATRGRFYACIASLILMVVGGLASMAHLASPQNVMAAATNLFSFSGISVELIMLGLTFIAVTVYAVLIKREAGETARKVVAVISLFCGLGLAFACGHGYVIDARVNWNTNILPVAYLCSVLPAGVFAYMLCGAAVKEDAAQLLSLKLVAVIAADLSAVSLIAYLVFIGDASMRNVAVFVGVVLCGIVITLACAGSLYASFAQSNLLAVAMVGLIASAVGALCLRVLMWVASDAFANLFGLATQVMFAG